MIEVRTSKDYPGRTSVRHKLHADSNSTTVIDLTERDITDLLLALGVAPSRRNVIHKPTSQPIMHFDVGCA